MRTLLPGLYPLTSEQRVYFRPPRRFLSRFADAVLYSLMIKLIAIAVGIGLCSLSCAVFAHPGHGGQPLEHFAWLQQLAGSCWTGQHPDGRTRDTQCFNVQFGRFIHGTTRLSELRAGKWEQRFQGESVLAWDDANQRISYWYWTSSGAFGPAEAYFEGPQLHFPASRKPGANAIEVRMTWSRIDASSYRVSRQKRTGGEWKEIFTVVYKRATTKG